MKLVVDTETDKVLGASMCGPDAAEIMQVRVVVKFDVVPPDTGYVSSSGKKMAGEEPIKKTVDVPVKKKNPATVKISPWTLARLNAEEVSKAALRGKKKV